MSSVKSQIGLNKVKGSSTNLSYSNHQSNLSSRKGTATKPSVKTSRVNTNNNPVSYNPSVQNTSRCVENSFIATSTIGLLKEPLSVKRKRNGRVNSLAWN